MTARRFRLTVITPALAGSGEELTPIDYMVWQNEVRVLDQEKIFRLLARNPRLEGYLDQLRKSERLDWAQWGGYAQSYSSERIPFASAGLAATWEKSRNDDLYIPRFTRSAGRGVIHGSALKGAIRTAWLLGILDEAKTEALWKEQAKAPRLDHVLGRPSFSVGDARAGADPFRIFQSRVLVLRGKEKPSEWKPGQQFVEMARPGATFDGRASLPEACVEPVRVQARRWIAQHAAYAKLAALKPLQESVERLVKAEAELAEGSLLLPLGWGTGLATKALLPKAETAEMRMLVGRMPGVRKGPLPDLPFPKTRRLAIDGAGSAALCGWVRLDWV